MGTTTTPLSPAGSSALTAASSLPETPDALAALVPLGRDVDAATGEGVAGLRAASYSWADIVARLSITRQAAQQRWGGESG